MFKSLLFEEFHGGMKGHFRDPTHPAVAHDLRMEAWDRTELPVRRSDRGGVDAIRAPLLSQLAELRVRA